MPATTAKRAAKVPIIPRSPYAAKTVILRKQRDLHGSLPEGWLYSWTYRSTPESQAVPRAFQALKREHPDENVHDWHAEQTA